MSTGGGEFRRAHALAYPNANSSALLFGDGSFALSYLMDNQGSGYFPTKAIQAHLKTKKLVRIPNAPAFSLSVFVSVGDSTAKEDGLKSILQGLT